MPNEQPAEAAVTVKAFVSHAAEDKEVALRLRDQLTTRGIECWCYEEDLRHGDHIEANVRREIHSCDYFIVVLSQHALTSSWVCRELGYAKQLQDERGGVQRPWLIPVHTYEALPQPFALQPLGLDTQQPLGGPIPFHSHRCYRAGDAGELDALASTMKPRLTRILEPRGRDRRLFEGFGLLMEQLFPNHLDRPDIDEIRDWLESDLHQPDAQPWPEVLLAAHTGEAVTGFLYMNYSRSLQLGYVSFFGISRFWRPCTHMRWLIERGRAELEKLCPQIRGVFFQVDPPDLESCRRLSAADSPLPREQVDRLQRIVLFQNAGALLLHDANNVPVQLPQPSLRPPLGPPNELEHWLMLLPSRQGDEPRFGSWITEAYLSLAEVGFGPRGANVPGYMAYLADFAKRFQSLLPADASFTKLYLSHELRTTMRRPRPLDRHA